MVEPTSCVLVVPCYNEAKRLRPAEYVSFAATHNDIRYVFVDDGSTDATRSALSAIVEQLKQQASLLVLPRNVGKGEAVRQGVLHSLQYHPTFFGYWDADLATPLAAVDLLLQSLHHLPELDLAFGSRVRLLGHKIVRSALRHYLGRMMATAVSLAVGVRAYDTQCGAKLFRNSPRTRQLFDAPFTSRWLFDVELLVRLLPRHGMKSRYDSIVEIPMPEWTDVPGSKVTMGAAVCSLFDLVRFAIAHRRAVRY